MAIQREYQAYRPSLSRPLSCQICRSRKTRIGKSLRLYAGYIKPTLPTQYNKLRKYRGQVVRLESELHEHKVQASSTKNKYADWNSELQKKLKELREEKKSWMTEAASLRRTQTDNKVYNSALPYPT